MSFESINLEHLLINSQCWQCLDVADVCRDVSGHQHIDDDWRPTITQQYNPRCVNADCMLEL